MAFLDFGSPDPAMNDPLDIDSILMPPPSKRLRGETIVSPEEAHSKGVVLSLPPGRDQRQNSDPAWSTEADLSPFTFKKSQEGFETTVSEELSGKNVSLELPQSVMASRTIPANDTTAPDQGSTFKQRRNVEEESIGTGSETVIDSVNDGSKSAWQTPAKTRFSDIIGHAAAKLRIDEMLLPLALPPSLAKSVLSGVRSLPPALLLYGPPGCGKTQLAQAIAGEAQGAFVCVGPSDILSKFVGESEASVRSLFKYAYTEAESVASHCSVLFFDEIDALGHSRGPTGGNTSQDGGDGCSRRVLAELLIQLTQLADRANREESCDELDCSSDADDSPNTAGGKHSPRVIVVAATNRPEDCDAALLRRFPVRVHVGLPSQRDRRKILSKFLGEFGHNITASQLEELAAATDGWSGSDLESLTREAAMAPIRECLRHAATMKRRARKREQKGGDESSQQEQRKSVDADEEAREVLLSSFNKLRPVTLRDFEAAMEFWLGNQQTTFIGEIPQEVSHVHYDSSSSSEEEDN